MYNIQSWWRLYFCNMGIFYHVCIADTHSVFFYRLACVYGKENHTLNIQYQHSFILHLVNLEDLLNQLNLKWMVHGGGVANTVSAKSLTVHLASLDWQLLTPCFQERQTCNSLSRGKVTLEHLHPWEGRAEAAADSTTGWHCSGLCSSSGIFCACWFGIWDLASELLGTLGWASPWETEAYSQDCNFRQDQEAPRSSISLYWGGHEILSLSSHHYIDANILTK